MTLIELLDLQRVVVVAAALGDVALARVVVEGPIGGRVASVGAEDLAVQVLEGVAEGDLVPERVTCP